MKKKALALLLAAAMAIQPLSVAGAGEFTDGQSVDVEAEAVEEVAEEPVEVFTDNAAEEPVVEEEKAPRSEVLREPIKDAIQIGDKVWVTFDNVTQTATIWGEGRTWDYDALGWEEIKGQHFNPFRNRAFQNIVIKNNITYLGNNLFSSCSGFGDELIIPDDVTAIGESTFQCIMGLKKVVLPKNISAIGKMAFAQCEDLTEVVNPGTLKEISEHAFMWCSDLGKFDFSGVEKIGVGAFDGTNFKKLYLTNDLRIIEDDAFSGANIQELNIPESVVKIGAGAFSGNNMENLIIPNTVSELESSVFAECNNLTNVVLPNMEIELVSTFENCDRLLFVSIPERITSLIGTFSGCDRLSTVEIKGSKTQIPTYGIDNDESAFDMCPRLTLIKGQYCSYAKKYANDHKISFTNFEPQNEHDWSAEKIVIKESTCTESGEKVFLCNICGETKESEEIPARNHSWNWGEETTPATCEKEGVMTYRCRYDGCNATKTEPISALGHEWSNWSTTKEPTETEEGERQRDCWRCDKIETEKIPKISPIRFEHKNVNWQNYDKLSVSAKVNKPVYFYVESKKANEPEPKFDESKLDKTVALTKNVWKEIVVPEEPVTVYLFVQDKDGNSTYTILEPYYEDRPEKPATTIKVGDNVYATIEGNTLTLSGRGATYDYEYYGEHWYKGDRQAIKKIVFNGDITYIGNFFFVGFAGITELKFPEGLQRMGKGVLNSCGSLITLEFPSTLKEIQALCEEGDCESLTTVIISEGVEVIGEGAFWGSTSLVDVNLPTSIKEIKKGAFSNTAIDKFTWPSNINVIPESVFESTKLIEFSVPETVTKIEAEAFNYCKNLKKITIPKSVKYIGNNAFLDSLDVVIYGERDSQAEQYAYINNIPFVSDCFKVIFKEDGRTKETEYVKKGENATPPTLASRPGYTLSWDADYTNITEDMVINAVWTKDGADKPEPPIIVYPPSETKYTVTFKDRGKVIKTEKVVSGEAADFPYVSRYGYELSWDKDFSKVTSNMTVNAVWTVIKPAKVTSMTAEVLPKYARLSWDETEFTSYYLVYRKAAADKEFKQVAKTTRVLWNDKKVKPGNEYQYKVAAVRSVEGKKYQGEYSDAVTAKIGKPETGDIYSVGKLNYKIMNSNEVRVTGFAKDTASLSIPTSVSIVGKSYKITSIDHKAFYRNANLIDVKIGNNVTYVGKYAFYQCPNLETVKFGGRVQTISTCAFTQCPKLGNVVLPSSVERLGAKAFFKCTSMRIITVKTSRLNYLGTKAFAINPKITIRVPKSKYSAYVKMIKKSGRYAATKYQKF